MEAFGFRSQDRLVKFQYARSRLTLILLITMTVIRSNVTIPFPIIVASQNAEYPSHVDNIL